MKIVKEKDIFQPQRPDLSGIYFQLSYDPREFGGDQKAITDEIISVISEKRPELGEELRGAQQDKEVESLHNPTVDPAIFSFLDIDGNLGLIKAGLVGPEWKNFINQDQPIVNPSAKNKSVAPKATSDKFIEVSYETPNVNGTPMAVGSVRTLEDINEENKDRISNEIITFIKKNHPEIKVDKNSLDFSKIDENKIQYMVGIMGGNVTPELSADEEFDITEKRMEEQERLEQEELAARTPEEIAQDEEDEREYQKLMAELNAPDEPISQDETPLDENGKPINTASSKKN